MKWKIVTALVILWLCWQYAVTNREYEHSNGCYNANGEVEAPSAQHDAMTDYAVKVIDGEHFFVVGNTFTSVATDAIRISDSVRDNFIIVD